MKKFYYIKRCNIRQKTELVVRNIEKSNKNITRQFDMIVDYDYKFNTATDSDIKKPDITGLTLSFKKVIKGNIIQTITNTKRY